MTHITLPRAIVEQALEALEMCRLNGSQYLYGNERDLVFSAIKALRAALAQQAEPVEPVGEIRRAHYGGRSRNVGFDTAVLYDGANVRPGDKLYTAPPQQAEPVCPDCRGLGYDASGQLCGCQDKPSPCAYPNCVGGQAGTICKPSCPGGTK